MEAKKFLEDNPALFTLYKQLKELYSELNNKFQSEYNRVLPFNEMIVDRWEKGASINAGINTNIYDSCMILGDVKIGKECWVGPNTILDGSGGLKIGDFCTISAGVQIYSHDNVFQTLSSKKLPIERKPVDIGNNVYIAPNAVITKGITIGDNTVIGAFALVNKSVPSNSIVMGQPGKVVGEVINKDEQIKFTYY